MGDKLQYWSRNNKDHAVQSSYSVMNAVAARQIKPESCILDGEFIVWNKSRSGPRLPLLFAHNPARSTAACSEPAQLQQSVRGFTDTSGSLGLLPECCCHAATQKSVVFNKSR